MTKGITEVGIIMFLGLICWVLETRALIKTVRKEDHQVSE